MKELLFIQHCQSEHHINGLMGGWTDTPLTELGRKQANAMGQYMSRHIEAENYRMFSSDLLRASQTAEILSQHLQISNLEFPELREQNFGVSINKPHTWFLENRVALPISGRLDHILIEGAESWRMFYQRVSSGLEVIENLNIEKAIVVAHGGTLSCAIAWWLNIPVEVMTFARFRGRPGAITRLTSDKQQFRILERLAFDQHLAKRELIHTW